MSDKHVILLAEDREDDILLIRKAFQKCGMPNPLFVVRDGAQAIAYLSGTGEFANRHEFPLPALLLLDLKMPGVDGFEVLEWLREQASLASLLVVVLTSSSEDCDVNRAFKLGANSFLPKPQDFTDIVETCRLLQQYWLEMCRLPELSRPSRL